MSKLSNGSIEWREDSTVYIGWLSWSTSGTKSQEGKLENRGFFLVAIERKGHEATYLTHGGVVSIETLGINKGKT